MVDLTSIPPRNYRGDRPIEMDRRPVKVLGEPLHPIWWRGRQWAVTEYGIEALDGRYVIAADRLDENIDIFPWPSHMGGKLWVDTEDFTTAWLVALVLHGCQMSGERIRNAVRRSVLHKGD